MRHSDAGASRVDDLISVSWAPAAAKHRCLGHSFRPDAPWPCTMHILGIVSSESLTCTGVPSGAPGKAYPALHWVYNHATSGPPIILRR